MATKDWQTTSVRLTEEENNALKLLCERESNVRKKKITRNKLIKELILEEIDPLMKTSNIPKGRGIPKIGEHRFNYDFEKDDFLWQLDLGTEGLHVLCEDVSFKFLDSLKNKIEYILKERDEVIKKTKGKTIIPKKIMKFKVK